MHSPMYRDDEYVNKLKLIFWHAMGGPLGDVLDEMVKRYNKESDKYHVHTNSWEIMEF